MEITKRFATSDEMELLFFISKRALKDQVEEMFGAWDETEQCDRFFRSTDPSVHEIIFENQIPIGLTAVLRSGEKICLERISIVPESWHRHNVDSEVD